VFSYGFGGTSCEFGDFSVIHCLTGWLPELIPLQYVTILIFYWLMTSVGCYMQEFPTCSPLHIQLYVVYLANPKSADLTVSRCALSFWPTPTLH